MNKHNAYQIMSIIAILLVVSISCSRLADCDEITYEDKPEGIPLSEFIIGSWLSESAYNITLNEEINYIYEIEFRENGDWLMGYFNKEGYIINSDIWPYRFINEDTLFIDNLRIEGGETWKLTRVAKNLKIEAIIGGLKVQYELRRGTYHCDYKIPTKDK